MCGHALKPSAHTSHFPATLPFSSLMCVWGPDGAAAGGLIPCARRLSFWPAAGCLVGLRPASPPSDNGKWRIHSLVLGTQLCPSCTVNVSIFFKNCGYQTVWPFDTTLRMTTAPFLLPGCSCVPYCCPDAVTTCSCVCVRNYRKQAEQGPEALPEPALPEILAWPRTAADHPRQPLSPRRALWVHDCPTRRSVIPYFHVFHPLPSTVVSISWHWCERLFSVSHSLVCVRFHIFYIYILFYFHMKDKGEVNLSHSPDSKRAQF